MLICIGYRYITFFDVYSDSLSYFFMISPDISKNKTKKENISLVNLIPGYLNVCISYTNNKTINSNSQNNSCFSRLYLKY
jgi:hypothetical protein